MPGSYAHLTLANELNQPRILDRITSDNRAKQELGNYFHFIELGAVSPDYPYLDLIHPRSKQWADKMHYENTGEMIKAGVSEVRRLSGRTKYKCLSWLLGYASHVVADVCVHPVVNLKVGPYEQNKKDHRVCEMHQDVHIFKNRMNLTVTLAEHLDSGIGLCGADGNNNALDADIEQLWQRLLSQTYNTEYHQNPPQFDHWHRGFMIALDGIADEGAFFPFGRHVAQGYGLTYPQKQDVDATYTHNLQTNLPSPNDLQHYEMIFDRAVSATENVWRMIFNGVFGSGAGSDLDYKTQIGNWNLDTGQDEHGRFVFWA